MMIFKLSHLYFSATLFFPVSVATLSVEMLHVTEQENAQFV